jgi:hypothetical protein
MDLIEIRSWIVDIKHALRTLHPEDERVPALLGKLNHLEDLERDELLRLDELKPERDLRQTVRDEDFEK